MWHLLKMAKIGHFAQKVLFSTISACIFNNINVCLYPLHSIYNYILSKLNFQKNVQYCFKFKTLLQTERCAVWTSTEPLPIVREKGTHVCWTILLAFSQTIYTFSKIFAMIFYPIFYKFDPCVFFFLGGEGVKMGPMFTDFFFFFKIKSTHLGGTSPYILHMWSSFPLGPVGAPKQFRFHQRKMRILQPNYMKKVLGRITFVNG